MTKRGTLRNAQASALDDVLRRLVRDQVRDELATLHAAGVEWTPARPLGLSPKIVHKLVREHGIRATKIGRALYVHRDDVNALGARNIIRPPVDRDAKPGNDVDELAGFDPEVAAAFGLGGQR